MGSGHGGIQVLGMQLPLKSSVGRSMVLARAFYLLYFAAAAALIPFIALYYEQVGLSPRQIGLLAAMPPLTTLLSAPLWGGLADATQQHHRLLGLAIGGTLIAVLALSLTGAFYWLIPVVLAYAFFAAPIIPLVDNTVIDLLGERRSQYGRQRLWGALGWGFAAPIVGLLVERTGLQWAFYSYLVLMFGGLVVSFRLPVGRVGIGRHFWQDLRLLLTNRRWILFLMTVLVGGLSLAIVINFLFLYLDDLGASKSLMGLSLTVATISELPVWFLSSRLLSRWGTRGLLAVSLVASALQAFAYSSIRTPWLVMPIQLLHGPAFAAMWVAGVSYASEIAPEGMGATAQGLFAGVVMGLRSALGAFVGGLLYDSLGAVPMFRWGGVSALLGLFLFVLIGIRRD
jgi:PPP family 3-phenylpropionic acid transporter